jgi:hypothetical protein
MPRRRLTVRREAGVSEPPTRPNVPLNRPRRGPSLAPGVVLLVIAAILMVVVLVKPDIPGWATTTIAILAIAVVIALLVYAFAVYVSMTRRGGS